MESQVTILETTPYPSTFITDAARTTRRSTKGDDYDLIKTLKREGAESMFRFAYVTARMRARRGILDELRTHAHLGFAAESTRIITPTMDDFCPESDTEREAYQAALDYYKKLREEGAPKEIARRVLPLGLCVTFQVTGNLQAWRHVLKLRTAPSAHPDMRKLMLEFYEKLLEVSEIYTVLLDDVVYHPTKMQEKG